MANEILFSPISATPVVFAHSADFDNLPYADTIELDLSSLGIGDSRESVKADMMAPITGDHLPQRWAVIGAFEHNVAPTATGSVDIYWAASPSATAGLSNPYLITGADAEIVTPTASFLGQLQFIGSVPLTNTVDVIHQKTFITSIPLRYGSVLVHNNSDQILETDADLMYVAFIPLVDEAQ